MNDQDKDFTQRTIHVSNTLKEYIINKEKGIIEK